MTSYPILPYTQKLLLLEILGIFASTNEVFGEHAWLCPKLDIAFELAQSLARGYFYGAVKEACLHRGQLWKENSVRVFCQAESFCVTEMDYQPVFNATEG